MSGRPLNVGVIGLGVGARHVAAYAGVDGVRVKAVCDIDPERLREIGRQFRVPHTHTDYRKLTEDPDIDVISICSYDDCHADQAVSALRHGKHVMIEKPIALHRHEAERILRAKEDSGRLLTSNLILRESPRFKQVKAMIGGGEFGEIFCVEGDYLHNIAWKITEGWRGKMDFYCTIYGGGIHLIDLMRWLLGQEVVSVCGMGTDILTRGSSYRRNDTFITVLKFGNGALGKCLTTLGPQRSKFHALNVYGTRKTFINDMPYGKLFDGDGAENERLVTTPYPGVEKGDLIPDFIAAIRNGEEPPVSATDVFRVMDICFAAWEASQTGTAVKINYLV